MTGYHSSSRMCLGGMSYLVSSARRFQYFDAMHGFTPLQEDIVFTHMRDESLALYDRSNPEHNIEKEAYIPTEWHNFLQPVMTPLKGWTLTTNVTYSHTTLDTCPHNIPSHTTLTPEETPSPLTPHWRQPWSHHLHKTSLATLSAVQERPTINSRIIRHKTVSREPIPKDTFTRPYNRHLTWHPTRSHSADSSDTVTQWHQTWHTAKTSNNHDSNTTGWKSQPPIRAFCQNIIKHILSMGNSCWDRLISKF